MKIPLRLKKKSQSWKCLGEDCAIIVSFHFRKFAQLPLVESCVIIKVSKREASSSQFSLFAMFRKYFSLTESHPWTESRATQDIFRQTSNTDTSFGQTFLRILGLFSNFLTCQQNWPICLSENICKNKTVLYELLYPISKAGGLGPLAIMALFMPLVALLLCCE